MADNNTNELDALMISELPTQATANETDLFEVAIVDANSASGYASKKESAAAIADAIVGQYQYPLRITGTTAKTIAGAINELKNLVDLLPQFAIEVVNTLPVSDISTTTIYLVPASDPEQGNYYEEYIYVNNAWELVGTTAVDLSGYYTSAQVDTLLAAKADTSSLAPVATSGAYSDLSGKPTIDTALDTTSTNAVENRAVAGAINSIKSDITVEGSASGDIATFVDGSDNPLKELKISIVATQSGSGDPSPTNVRPIIGFNAVNVGDISDTEKVQYFKGLLDGTHGFVDLGTVTWDYESNYNRHGFDLLSLSLVPKIPESNVMPNAICSNYKMNTSLNGWNNRQTVTQMCFDVRYARLYNDGNADGATYKAAMNGVYLIYELVTPTTPTITPTEFNTLVSAFGLQGWLVQIAMPTAAGTVYGGTLDVLTDKLTVTYKRMKGSDLTWNIVTASEHVFTNISTTSDLKYVATNQDKSLMCTNYKTTPDIVLVADLLNNEISQTRNGGKFIIRDDRFNADSVNGFITAIANVDFVYELATPIVYNLTPTEIRSLLGLNNVWADCGAITELKYTRDLNLCINDIIARIEALEGASSNRSLSVSPTLTKSLTSDSDKTEGILESKTEETEEETKEEAQNER